MESFSGFEEDPSKWTQTAEAAAGKMAKQYYAYSGRFVEHMQSVSHRVDWGLNVIAALVVATVAAISMFLLLAEDGRYSANAIAPGCYKAAFGLAVIGALVLLLQKCSPMLKDFCNFSLLDGKIEAKGMHAPALSLYMATLAYVLCRLGSMIGFVDGAGADTNCASANFSDGADGELGSGSGSIDAAAVAAAGSAYQENMDVQLIMDLLLVVLCTAVTFLPALISAGDRLICSLGATGGCDPRLDMVPLSLMSALMDDDVEDTTPFVETIAALFGTLLNAIDLSLIEAPSQGIHQAINALVFLQVYNWFAMAIAGDNMGSPENVDEENVDEENVDENEFPNEFSNVNYVNSRHQFMVQGLETFLIHVPNIVIRSLLPLDEDSFNAVFIAYSAIMVVLFCCHKDLHFDINPFDMNHSRGIYYETQTTTDEPKTLLPLFECIRGATASDDELERRRGFIFEKAFKLADIDNSDTLNKYEFREFLNGIVHDSDGTNLDSDALFDAVARSVTLRAAGHRVSKENLAARLERFPPTTEEYAAELREQTRPLMIRADIRAESLKRV